MRTEPIIKVIIPALDEERSIGLVVNEIPKHLVDEVIVVDNGSNDKTGELAGKAGATVLFEQEKGYGAACLRGMAYLAKQEQKPDLVVFMDADHSDDVSEMSLLLEPILLGEADLVIGSRALGKRERGSMTLPQIFGNWLATRLLKILYGVKFTDLGPFRAIKWEELMVLGMEDRNYGWTVEMQLRAAKRGLRCREVAVSYRKRIGTSKVSGTVKGTIMAGYKILWTIFRYL